MDRLVARSLVVVTDFWRSPSIEIWYLVYTYVIFSGLYRSVEMYKIVRVGTRNNTISIAAVSQNHVLVYIYKAQSNTARQ